MGSLRRALLKLLCALVYFTAAVRDVVDADLSGCSRYSKIHSCKEMFWTAGQRYDLAYKPSSFVWKYTPGTGSCCDGRLCVL